MNVQSAPASDSGAHAPAPAAAVTPAAAAPAVGAVTPASGEPAAAAAPAAGAPAAAAPAAATKPDYLPDAFWDAEKGAVKADDLGKILTAHAERQAKAITDPTKVDLKTALKDADGNEITFNMESPVMKAATVMAKERGWSTDDLQAMGEIVVQAQLAAAEADKAEYLKIGNGDRAKADARLNAVIAKGAPLIEAGPDGKPTAEATQALTRLFANVHGAAEFEVLEKLINGHGGPSAAASGGGNGNVVDMASSWYPNEAKKAG